MQKFLITASDKVFERWKSNKVSSDYKKRFLMNLSNTILDDSMKDMALCIVVRTQGEISYLGITTEEEINESN